MAAARKGSRIMSVTYISEKKGFRYREKYFFMEEVFLNERIPKSGWMHSGILSLLFRCCCSVKYAVRYEVSNNILFAKRFKDIRFRHLCRVIYCRSSEQVFCRYLLPVPLSPLTVWQKQ